MNRLEWIMILIMTLFSLFIPYELWIYRTQKPLTHETQPGPVAPVPKIEDHVAAVIEMDRNCPACPECPTWDALKRAGVEIICTNAFGEVPSVNYWPVEVGMACSRIKEVRITNDKIKVIGGKR